MPFWSWMFSFHGRIGRGRWWAAQLVYLVVLIVGVGIIAIVAAATNPNQNNYNHSQQPNPVLGLFVIIGIILWIMMFVSSISVCVKRCHDRGYSGWIFLLMILVSILPLGFLWYIIDLGILKGVQGPNEYGQDPQGGFSGTALDTVFGHATMTGELARLQKLFNDGVINRDEFEMAKQRIIST